MATITARFPGQCRACGGSFAAGAQIEWTKASGSRHVKCPEQPAVAQRPAGDVSITLTVDWRHAGKPLVDSEVGKSFRVTERSPHQGEVVTVLTQRRHHQSAEDNEDMGDCMGGGWWLTLGCRLATPEETAKLEAEEAAAFAAEEARIAKAADERAAKLAAIATGKAKLAELTAGLVATESYDACVIAQDPEPTTVAKWSDGGRHSVEIVERKATTGETIFLAYSHDFDDDRTTLYAPRTVVEAAWAKVAERYGETPAKARAFLDKYHQCVGADWRRWLVERAALSGTP